MQVAQAHWRKSRQAWQQAQQQVAETAQCIEHWQAIIGALERDYQVHNRPERRYSKLAQARGRLDVQQRRLARRIQAVQRAQQRVEKVHAGLEKVQQHADQLAQRLQRFEQENASNPMPLNIILRMDAGFGSADNLALLIEMGYAIYTKPHSHWVTDGLKKEVNDDSHWVRVGDNAEMIAWSQKTISNLPYSLDVALVRFYTGSTVKYSTLLHYGHQPVTTDLAGWFQDYNARQTVEAGIKEGKGIFKMKHFKVRSQAGLFLQEYFATFAANFVRWAAHWLTVQCAHTPLQPALSSVKTMVKVAAHTAAWVIWQPHGCLLMFTEHSIFAGLSLQVQAWSFQLPLPLFKNDVFVPT